MLKGNFNPFEIFCMIFNVLSLSFIKVDPPHDFIMLLAGHHVFNSIQAILSQYKSCIFDAVSINLFSFQPNICSIIGNSYGEFIIDFTTFSGAAKNQSDVINSAECILGYHCGGLHGDQ